MVGVPIFLSDLRSSAKASESPVAMADVYSSAEQVSAETKKEELLINPPESMKNMKTSDWRLPLVGPSETFTKAIDEKDLKDVGSGELLDKRVVADYQAMAAAALKDQFQLRVISGYRSVNDQEQVLSQRVNQLMSSEGLDQKAAEEKAKLTMTTPGCSEHHTGLALDVVDNQWEASGPGMLLDESYGQQPGAKWLAAHCAEYGFIIRYPEGKENLTGITYEPWHLRYVGKENAAYITSHQLTLEEYLELVKKWESYGS